MTRSVGKSLLAKLSAPIVGIWVGLITKRLLDTLVESLGKNQLELCHWFAFLTTVIMVVNIFVLLIMFSDQGSYKIVLEVAPTRIVVGVFVTTQLIMVCLYVMAYWFALRTDQYLVVSASLVSLLVIFDQCFIFAVAETMKQVTEGADPLNSLLQSAKVWRSFDIELLVLLLLLLVVVWKHALDFANASAAAALLFAATNYIVPRVFVVELTVSGPTREGAKDSSLLPNAYLGENASAAP